MTQNQAFNATKQNENLQIFHKVRIRKL